jgi:ferredoxin
MAFLETNTRKIEITDGESIKDACMDLGIPFGCESGICGTCIIEVMEGMNNLSEQNESEEMMELDANQRLGCQCKIRKGIVKIDYE